jgi:hypothetical protein
MYAYAENSLNIVFACMLNICKVMTVFLSRPKFEEDSNDFADNEAQA